MIFCWFSFNKLRWLNKLVKVSFMQHTSSFSFKKIIIKKKLIVSYLLARANILSKFFRVKKAKMIWWILTKLFQNLLFYWKPDFLYFQCTMKNWSKFDILIIHKFWSRCQLTQVLRSVYIVSKNWNSFKNFEILKFVTFFFILNI